MESQSLLYAVLGVAFGPFVICVFLVICLATSGQSLGLRKLGLLILIKTFEFVSHKVREDDLINEYAIIDRSGVNGDSGGSGEKVTRPSSWKTSPELRLETDGGKSFYISDGEEEEENGNANISGAPRTPVKGHARTQSADTALRGPAAASSSAASSSSSATSATISPSIAAAAGSTSHIIDRELYNPKEFAETVVQHAWQQQKQKGEGGESGERSLPRVKSLRSLKRDFQLSDVTSFAKAGVEAIIEDQVTSRFRAEELTTWNLLTRTNQNYQFRSKRLCALWGVGFFIRYFILFPFRLTLSLFGIGLLVVVTAVIGYLPAGKLKQILNRYFSLVCYRILSRSFSAIITYHNRENMARPKGICVANHTTPIDVVVLSCDNAYAMVGQKHVGFLGVLQTALHRATDHIWFERSAANDRMAVSRRLREHVEDEDKLPILIFPEGTCINNTSVMMFKKGSFEVGGTIHPVAIKYHPEFGDAFWNSSEQSMVTYIIMMMTSWAIVADVWYLPEMTRREDEHAIIFANRVKREICLQGGLVDLDWDGMLKRQKPKASLLAQAQQEISKSYNSNSFEANSADDDSMFSAASDVTEVLSEGGLEEKKKE